METSFTAILQSFWLTAMLCSFAAPLRAEQFGQFTYQVLGGSTIEITDYPDDATGAVEIPAEISGKPVSTISRAAFGGCTGLTSVSIPPGVSVIWNRAFAGCHGLTSVSIPASVTYIDHFAFYDCRSLISVTLPNGVTRISESTFEYCSSLTSVTIPSGVVALGASAFAGCSSLASVVIPSGVTSIGDSAFSNCPALTSVTIPGSVSEFGKGAFQNCTGLTGVTIASGVTTIGDFAFGGCSGLTSILIPASVTSMSGDPFVRCSRLESILVESGNPNFSSAGGVLLYDSGTLVSVSKCPEAKTGVYAIPPGVVSISPFAFENCIALRGVIIPSGVTAITYRAFRNCTGLTSLTIPASVTTIGAEAFFGCSGLASAVFLGNSPMVQSPVFAGTPPEFRIYYLNGRTGFYPTYFGVPVTMIDEAIYPAGTWLVSHGYQHDASLHEDTDGDGVNLLMAYALNLDPRLNLKSSLPQPVLDADTLSMSFHAASPGIAYRAEASADLQHWTTDGVTQTAPGPDQRSTASVSRDAPRRFLRLVVED